MSASEIARVYVHASYVNPFKSGWGVVIQHGSELHELYKAGEGHDGSTLHIVATIEALRTLPAGMSVEILSSLSYLTEWVIPLLPDLRLKGYNSKNGKYDYSEMLRTLDLLVLQRPSVTATLVRKVDRNEHHKRAAVLAGLYGEDASAYDLQAKIKARARQIKPGEPVEDYW